MRTEMRMQEQVLTVEKVGFWRDFMALVKFRLNITVVFSAAMAFAIAADGQPDWLALLFLSLGGFFVTGASNALNQVLEKDYDRLMKRTADRPVAAGRWTVSQAVLSAGLMALAGIMLLALFNVWAAFFGTLALLSYAFIYTPLKRVNSSAIAVGAVPGALPVLIGSVAFEGELTILGWTLFAIQFLWQFPHFMAIGWLGFDDYQKAGFRFIPEKDGQRDPLIGRTAAWYAFALVPLTLAMGYFGLTGWTSAAVCAGLSLAYAWFGLNLFRRQNRKSALQLMFSSFFYLPLVLITLYLDKL